MVEIKKEFTPCYPKWSNLKFLFNIYILSSPFLVFLLQWLSFCPSSIQHPLPLASCSSFSYLLTFSSVLLCSWAPFQISSTAIQRTLQLMGSLLLRRQAGWCVTGCKVWGGGHYFLYFICCNWMASSFLKCDLSGTLPQLLPTPTVSLFLESLIRKVIYSPLERSGQRSREKLKVLLPCFSVNEMETQKKIPIKEKSFMEKWSIRNNAPPPIPCNQ